MPDYERPSEAKASRCLRAILRRTEQGESIRDTEGFDEFLDWLEHCLQGFFCDAYEEGISLDGISPIRHAVKLGPNEAELFGYTYVLTIGDGNPTVILYVRLRIDEEADRIVSLDGRVGEFPKGVVDTGRASRWKALGLAKPTEWNSLQPRRDLDSINWIYEVVVGDDYD